MKKLFLLSISTSLLFVSCKKNELQPTQTGSAAAVSNITADKTPVAFLGTAKGFFAYNAGTGALLWSYTPQGNNVKCESTPCVAGRLVYFNELDSVYCADATTGRMIWQVKSHHAKDALSIADGKLYFSYRQGCICLNAVTGKKVWDFLYEAPTQDFLPFSAPSVVNGVVYVGGGLDNNLYALNASTGTIIWKSTNRGAMVTSPCVYNNLVFTNNRFEAQAIDITNGKLIWKKPMLNYNISAPTVAGNQVLFSADSLYSLDQSNGDRLWSFEDVSSEHAEPSANCFTDGSSVYVVCVDRYYKLDITNANVIWAKQYESSSSGLTVAAGNVFFNGVTTGSLFAINSSNGNLNWSKDNGNSNGSFAGVVVITQIGDVVYPALSGMRQ